MDIKAVNVSKTIGNEVVLRNVSFNVNRGDVFALVGPNGAGKTTIIRIILNLYNCTSGEVFVDGISVNDRKYDRVRNRIGFVLDNIGLFKDLNAWENIEFFDRIYNPDASWHDRNSRITKLLKTVDLYSKKNDAIAFFSRGMKQRLALARALINDPELLILDEPSRGLDVEGRLMLKDFVSDMKKKDCTVFVNSHDLTGLQVMCTKLAFIDHGVILDSGSYAELRERFGGNTYSVKIKKPGKWMDDLKTCSFVIGHSVNETEVVVSLKKDYSDFPEWLRQNDASISELTKIDGDLEDIYKKVIAGGRNEEGA